MPYILKGRKTSLLFPGAKLEPKTDSAMRGQIERTIKSELGLTINPHLFRHLAGLIYLQAHPGQYEAVRQLLGHKNIQTTIDSYTGLEAEKATQLYAAILEEQSTT